MGRDHRKNGSMKSARLKFRIGLFLLAALLFFGGLAKNAAQPAIGGRIRNFQTFANDRQGKRTVLRGKDAKNVSRDVAEIIGPRLESVNESNQVTLTIEAPQCFYNNQTQIATSAENISLKMGGGRVSITGRGWTWAAGESRLVISNAVVAVIDKQALQTPQATNNIGASLLTGTNKVSDDIHISSTGFEYQADTITFREQVIVTDVQGVLNCRTLRAKLIQPGNKIERIEADEDVRIVQKGTVATGGRAVYLMSDDEIMMTNSPAWKMEDKEGTSDSLVLNRKSNHLHTAGHVYMKLPLSSVLTNGLDSGAISNRVTNVVEITSQVFDYDQKLAVYRGDVHAKETQGTIDSELLTIYFAPGGSRPERIVAETNVTMVRGDSRVQGSKATYEIQSDLLRVEGAPKWQIGDKHGESTFLVLLPRTQEFQAGGGVHMTISKVPGMSLVMDSGSRSNLASQTRTNELMDVFADRLDHKDNLSIFENAVRINDPEGEIRCEFLVISTGASNQVTQIVADKNVVITQTNMVTRSDRAFYTLTNGIVELTGSPKLKAPDRLLTADVFLLNRSNNTFKTRGKYRIEMLRPPESRRTNEIRSKS
ncbi:MAG: LPS-assembly protein LptD [Verrucomicrobiales bacterium]|nr:LPS-assembly protein LptD [Verrucomicrobiales bacterium]